MADRVLPSDKERWPNATPLYFVESMGRADSLPRVGAFTVYEAVLVPADINDVIKASSGRLVDREAINYGAAKEWVDIWLETVDIHDDDAEQIYALVMDAIDAALPDQGR